MKTRTQTQNSRVGLIAILKFIKSLFISLIITFACIIVFAFVIKWTGLADCYITPVNLVIKAISVFAGAFILTKKQSGGLIKGGVFAVIYTLISFTIFSILAGGFHLGLGLVSDFAFNIVVGAVAGIIGVNKQK